MANQGNVVGDDRIRVLDMVRGLAVLGILMMNIQAFSMPMSAYYNPTVFGDFTGINHTTWFISHLFFDQKFMSLFSILFGIGILIFAERADQKEGHSGKRHYIRMAWLFVFGMLHAYLIWWGDILVMYAISGCLAYLFRDAKIKTLLWSSLGLISIVWLMLALSGLIFPYLSEAEIEKDILPMWNPAQEILNSEIGAYQGSWGEAFSKRIEQALKLQSESLFILPKILGLNLIGMILYKSGFVQGQWSKMTYSLTGLCLTMLGLGLTYYGALQNQTVEFIWSYSMTFGMQYNYWGSSITAIGYFSLLMLFANNINGSFIKRSFAYVGQMAFTNYIAQSLICTTVIYGYGFALNGKPLYGNLERHEQAIFVLGVWVVLMVFSNVWMRLYRFGLLEWVWRSLTYGKIQSPKR